MLRSTEFGLSPQILEKMGGEKGENADQERETIQT